jgi:hypothetical protein
MFDSMPRNIRVNGSVCRLYRSGGRNNSPAFSIAMFAHLSVLSPEEFPANDFSSNTYKPQNNEISWHEQTSLHTKRRNTAENMQIVFIDENIEIIVLIY